MRILNLNSNYTLNFILKIAPLKYEFTSFNQNLPRITRTALTQIAVLKPTEVSWQEKSNLIKFTPNNRLAKIRFNFIIIRLKFKLLKLILMYNLYLRKIIKIPNLRSKNGRGSSKSRSAKRRNGEK